jgi:hypothetical protein
MSNPRTALMLKVQDSVLQSKQETSFLESMDNMLTQSVDMVIVLCMYCLYSQVHGGFKHKIIEQLQRDLFLVYGHENSLVVDTLIQCGLLKVEKEKGIHSLFNQLKILKSYESSLEPEDGSFAYHGYCPITVRLAELANATETSSWSGKDQLVSQLPGETVQKRNAVAKGQGTLVVFVGGCTYGEIAAIRNLENTSGKKFAIMTTGIINTKGMFESLNYLGLKRSQT